MSKTRLVFAGTPEFAIPCLNALASCDVDLLAVYTQPDRPAGRGKKIRSSAVKNAAIPLGLNICQPESLCDKSEHEKLRSFQPDVMVVAAYGQILSPEMLQIPTLGCINLHASLLPRWRGAAPIHRAIQAGDTETGVTLMQMSKGCDTGDMLASVRTPILVTDTTASLHDRLAGLAAEMLVERLEDLLAGKLVAVPQDPAGVTHAAKISRQDAKIEWNDDAQVIERSVRAFTPWPGAWCPMNEIELKIWQVRVEPLVHSAKPGQVIHIDDSGICVACGQNSLRISELQRPGSRRMSAVEFLRGSDLEVGSHFKSPSAH
ncbi:MAG: methionyl-tRNA formyltransferase [Parasphingorhabdus sp.]